MKLNILKKYKCKICKKMYIKTRYVQPTCDSYDCNVMFAIDLANKALAIKNRTEKLELREKTENWKKKLQNLQENT